PCCLRVGDRDLRDADKSGYQSITRLSTRRGRDLRERLTRLHLRLEVGLRDPEIRGCGGERVEAHVEAGTPRTTLGADALLVDEGRDVRLRGGHERLDESIAGLAVRDGDVGEALVGA